MNKIALLLLLSCTAAQAQLTNTPCFPGLDTATFASSQFRVGVTVNGQWARWYCTDKATNAVTIVTFVGLRSEMPRISGRVDTMLKAADPLKSLQTAGSRFVVRPLSDPALATIYDDAKNSRGMLP